MIHIDEKLTQMFFIISLRTARTIGPRERIIITYAKTAVARIKKIKIIVFLHKVERQLVRGKTYTLPPF